MERKWCSKLHSVEIYNQLWVKWGAGGMFYGEDFNITKPKIDHIGLTGATLVQHTVQDSFRESEAQV